MVPGNPGYQLEEDGAMCITTSMNWITVCSCICVCSINLALFAVNNISGASEMEIENNFLQEIVNNILQKFESFNFGLKTL